MVLVAKPLEEAHPGVHARPSVFELHRKLLEGVDDDEQRAVTGSRARGGDAHREVLRRREL